MWIARIEPSLFYVEVQKMLISALRRYISSFECWNVINIWRLSHSDFSMPVLCIKAHQSLSLSVKRVAPTTTIWHIWHKCSANAENMIWQSILKKNREVWGWRFCKRWAVMAWSDVEYIVVQPIKRVGFLLHFVTYGLAEYIQHTRTAPTHIVVNSALIFFTSQLQLRKLWNYNWLESLESSLSIQFSINKVR